MPRVSFKFKKTDALFKKMRRYPDKALKAAGSSLYLEGEGIMTLSKEVYVPVDLGVLCGSGFVELPQFERNKVSIVLGFGGPAAPYAVEVHEDLQAYHTVGEAKYLSKPFRSSAKELSQRLADDIAKELRGLK